MIELPYGKRAIFCGWPGKSLWLQKVSERLQLTMACGWTPKPFKRKHEKDSGSVHGVIILNF